MKLRRFFCYVPYAAYSVFLVLIDRLTLLFPRQPLQKAKKRALFVKLDAIGDFILWLDAAKEVRKLYPNDEYDLTLLGNIAWTSLAEKIPYFDAVWPLDRHNFFSNPFYRLSILKKTRQSDFHIVVNPAFSREFLYGDAVVRASGAKKKIGSAGDHSNIYPWQKRISDRWYTCLVPASEAPMMELIRNAEFMRGLGLGDFLAGVPEMPTRAELPAGFNAVNYFVLFPGAGANFRRWSLANFKKLAELIHVTTGWTGIVCGSSGDRHLGEALKQETDSPLENWCGNTTLEEVIAIVAGARMVIGNETSAVHIAAAVSVPSVCIVGGGHYGRFIPYQVEIGTNRPLPVAVYAPMKCFHCNWRCQHKIKKKTAVQCIENITVDMVWKNVPPIFKGQSDNSYF